MEMIHQFYRDTTGASLVEYALLISFIALAAWGGMSALGTSITGSLNTAADGFN